MKLKITFSDDTTRQVNVEDSAILSLAVAAADYEDMKAREESRKKPAKVEGLTAAVPTN
jgi:hypothetical protein